MGGGEVDPPILNCSFEGEKIGNVEFFLKAISLERVVAWNIFDSQINGICVQFNLEFYG